MYGLALAFSPEELTETFRVAGVVPLVAVALSQVASDVVVKLVGEVLVTETDCEDGAVPPTVCEKDKDVCETMIVFVCAAVMLRVTGIVSGDEPPVTIMLAW